jgi:hypothetical protein
VLTAHDIARKLLEGPDLPVVVQDRTNYELEDWFETDQARRPGSPFFSSPENMDEFKGEKIERVIMLA